MHRSLFVVPVLAACAPSLGPSFEGDFTEFGGCADAYLYAATEDGSVAIQVVVRDVVADAGVEESYTATYTLPHDDVAITVFEGRNVGQPLCNDFIDDSTRVDREWEGASGTVTATVRPNATMDEGPRIDLLIEDVVLHSDGAPDASIDSLTWTDVLVGWLAG